MTTVLRETGIAQDFEALAQAVPRTAGAIAYAAARGTAVHADCHAYDDGDLVWHTVHAAVRPYVQAWAQFRNDKGADPVAHGRERWLYHPVYDYAGIVDGIFRIQARLVLLDIKTGDPEAAGARWQTAAYQAAWDYAHPDQPIAERWAVWLRPGRGVPYVVHAYTAVEQWRDFAEFIAFLTTFRRQRCRRRHGALVD